MGRHRPFMGDSHSERKDIAMAEVDRFERASIYEAQYFSDCKTQTEMVLDYMERFGEITPLEALTAIGCFRLSARIADLRAEGYEIETRINKGLGKKNYAIYSLKTEEESEK